MSKKNSKPFKIASTKKETIIEKSKILEEDYPIFCFKYLNESSIKDCKKADFFFDFLMRLKKLSELGWKEIRKSSKHSFGMEKIPKKKIIPQLPPCVTPEVKELHVFRANGNNLPFIGIETQNVFRVFFIETEFGHIYDH